MKLVPVLFLVVIVAVISSKASGTCGDTPPSPCEEQTCPDSDEHGSGSKGHGSGSKEHGSGSKEHGSGSKEHGSGSKEHGSGSKEHGSGSKEHGSGSKEHDSGSKEYESGSKEHGLGSKEHGSGSKKYGLGSKEHGSGSKEHGSGSKEHGSGSKEHGSRSKEHESGSKEHDSRSKEHGQECNEPTPEPKSCEEPEKPKIVVVMDVNRGIAHCGPEKILNTCGCQLHEIYWIPCLIEYLGVDDQPKPYTCVSLAQLDCFLSQFPCRCMPHCPNGYGYNATCVP